MITTILAFIIGWALIISFLAFLIALIYHLIKGDIDFSANPFRWF